MIDTDFDFNPQGFYVYVLWGSDTDRPLYVGRSSQNVCARIGSHVRQRPRGTLVRRASLIRCDSHADTLATELRLIHEHRPSWNVVGAPKEPGAALPEAGAIIAELPGVGRQTVYDAIAGKTRTTANS